MGMPLTGQVPGPYEDTTCQMVAAYGTRHHPHLETMRAFRDTVLKQCSIGQTIVDQYYNISQWTAPVTSKSSVLRGLTRYCLSYPAYLVSRAGLWLSAIRG